MATASLAVPTMVADPPRCREMRVAPPGGRACAEPVDPPMVERLQRLGMDRRYPVGDGSFLCDSEGRDVLDFTSQDGAVPFGHNDPDIWAAVDAFRRTQQPNFAQPSRLSPAGDLARDLLACAPPNLGRVTFVNGGAEAVEAAIRLARSKTGRRAIVVAKDGVHGRAMAAHAASGRRHDAEPFCTPDPDVLPLPLGDPAALHALFAARGGEVAMLLVEPVEGQGGVLPGYLHAAAALCRRYGALFAVDEVQTGLGRTGRMFATPDDVRPDVLLVGGALGGGLVPIGACLSTAEAFTERFALRPASTLAGGALATSVGRAVVRRLLAGRGAVLRNVADRGAELMTGLEAIARAFPSLIAGVRGRGLMIAVEFAPAADLADPMRGAVARYEGVANLFASFMLNRQGVRVSGAADRGDVVRVQPPLTVSGGECRCFLRAFAEAAGIFAAQDMAQIRAGLEG